MELLKIVLVLSLVVLFGCTPSQRPRATPEYRLQKGDLNIPTL